MKALSSPLARFWKEDVKIAREYPAPADPNGTLGEEFLREWAVSGLSFLSHPNSSSSLI